MYRSTHCQMLVMNASHLGHHKQVHSYRSGGKNQGPFSMYKGHSVVPRQSIRSYPESIVLFDGIISLHVRHGRYSKLMGVTSPLDKTRPLRNRVRRQSTCNKNTNICAVEIFFILSPRTFRCKHFHLKTKTSGIFLRMQMRKAMMRAPYDS